MTKNKNYQGKLKKNHNEEISQNFDILSQNDETLRKIMQFYFKIMTNSELWFLISKNDKILAHLKKPL